MLDAYRAAATLGHRRDGLWDYYPLLNALDAAFLLAARGSKTDITYVQVQALAAAATESAGRCFVADRVFFHAVAAIDADRIIAQWAALTRDQQAAAITGKRVQDDLIARYRELLGRMGSQRERNSTIRRLDDLVALLPYNSKGKAIAATLREIGGALAA